MDRGMEKTIRIPDDTALLRDLHAGETVLLSGVIFSARDQAHARMHDMLDKGQNVPVPLSETLIYYMGPSPARPGQVIGSAGPTTSGRMDPFAPRLLDLGLAGMIGKGPRSREVIEAIVRNRSVYFYAFGGCGALYAARIMDASPAAFEDLGPEAIYQLTVKDFPLIVAIDSAGKSIF
ncbi:MAG: fumarate hydratase C-terminal domain-containing protein [Spirochaetales bacterium]|nr:fumarate hydratase C-terminal domain-containing protein [Spirochaetales bacterium]